MNEETKETEKLREQAGRLEFITSTAVGFRVVICQGVPKPPKNQLDHEWQIMPENEFDSGEIVEKFWDWHLENNEQWFETMLEACADFVSKFIEFCRPEKQVEIFNKISIKNISRLVADSTALYTCELCGLSVDEISPWKEGECSGGVQHQFVKKI